MSTANATGDSQAALQWAVDDFVGQVAGLDHPDTARPRLHSLGDAATQVDVVSGQEGGPGRWLTSNVLNRDGSAAAEGHGENEGRNAAPDHNSYGDRPLMRAEETLSRCVHSQSSTDGDSRLQP